MDADPGYNSQADDQVDADMEQAQLRLEQLRKEKEEVELPPPPGRMPYAQSQVYGPAK